MLGDLHQALALEATDVVLDRVGSPPVDAVASGHLLDTLGKALLIHDIVKREVYHHPSLAAAVGHGAVLEPLTN